MMDIKKVTGNRTVTILFMVALAFVSFWIGTTMNGTPPATNAQENKETGTPEKKAIIWTCSMHPQIRMSHPGKCPICFMDLIPLKTGDSGDGSSDAVRLTMSENAKKLAGIETSPAIRRGMNATIRMTGKIALDETRVEMIAARVSGRIDRLYVDYTGIPVKAGDHLALIYSPELLSLQRELLEAAKAKSNAPAGDTTMVSRSIDRTFDAAREKLRLLGFSEGELEEILKRGTTSDHMTIRAGQNGVVLRKLVEEGSYVKTGMPLFHIADLHRLWVVLDAYESDLLWLRLGQHVGFTVEAYPGEQFDGTVSFIDPVVDPMSRTVKVRVEVKNGDLRLKPDMFVKGQITASVSKSGTVKNTSLRGKWICPMHPRVVKSHAGTCDICGMPLVRAEELGYVTSGFEDVDPLAVPATAVLYTGERSLVYVELPNTEKPTFEAREVVLGPRVGTYQIIKSGISEGENVVVNGSFNIDAELQIRAKPSMMSPEERLPVRQEQAPQGMPVRTDIPAALKLPVSDDFRKELALVNDQYFIVQKTLTKDLLAEAKSGLMKLRDIVENTRAPKGKQYNAWNSAASGMKKALEHAHHIAELPDARVIFENVSKQMIVLEKQYGHTGSQNYYLAFCPMAFDKKGAYWLQREKTISNPFFGKKMLNCGEIKEKL